MAELMYIIPGDACSRFTPSCLLFPRAAAYLLPSIVQFRLQSITMEKMILEKEGQQKLSALENDILKARKENDANIQGDEINLGGGE